jgi:hypothetical protein
VRNRFPRAVGRFRCSAEYLGSDIRAIACQDGSEEISFDWYDSSGYHKPDKAGAPALCSA